MNREYLPPAWTLVAIWFASLPVLIAALVYAVPHRDPIAWAFFAAQCFGLGTVARWAVLIHHGDVP